MLLIDTNIFLEVLFKQDKTEECKTLLYRIVKGEKEAMITDFSIDSIIIVLESKSKKNEISVFLKSLLGYKGLKVHPVSLGEKIFAAELMKKYALDFDDSIQVASALSNNINEIVSFDGGFDRIKEIKRLRPSET